MQGLFAIPKMFCYAADMDTRSKTLTDRLITHFGGRQRAAEALGVVGETLRLWKRDGIPLKAAIEVERLSGGAVTANEILDRARQDAA